MSTRPGLARQTERYNEMFQDVWRMINQESWQQQQRTECTCGQSALYACNDCAVPELCKGCMVDSHQALPFHRIRQWSERVNGYIPATLREIGVRVRLGHVGERCPHPREDQLEGLSMQGITTLTVEFCRCDGAWSDDDQIKARGWWPLGSNFVSVVSLQVLRVLVPNEPTEPALSEASDESGSESDGSGENSSGTESSTSA
ncbi:hypothetical protein B0H12DRAFT_1230666 [Mycena haematopus]|nr:hypothetical protein B0H12DRAFT_1230666 [Mycena haematopus]